MKSTHKLLLFTRLLPLLSLFFSACQTSVDSSGGDDDLTPQINTERLSGETPPNPIINVASTEPGEGGDKIIDSFPHFLINRSSLSKNAYVFYVFSPSPAGIAKL
jgi:hypothetical protein